MKITDYLKEQAERLKHTSGRIRDFRVFDFNYIPDEPLMRQEAKPIIDACLRYLQTGIANNLFLFGSRGSGKTLIVKYVSYLLARQQGARIFYVNCRQYNTSFKILAHLLHVVPRGCSLDELWARFCDLHTGKSIFILDEVDLISDKDRHKDILYLISRSPNNSMAILLSNHPRFLSLLDESVKSSLQAETIHFHNYDAEQIRLILEERARAGLAAELFSNPTFEPIIPAIAALTVQGTNADTRVAIKTLYYAALEPEEDVRELFRRARRDLVGDILADLNPRNLLILLAATRTPDPMVKQVYGSYRRLSTGWGEEPYSYVYFYTNLSYLQSVGLIVLLSTKVGRTYANRIQLLVDPDLIEGVGRTVFDL